MTPKTALHEPDSVRAVPDPRVALLAKALEEALRCVLHMRNGEKHKLAIAGSELEMLRINEAGACFMLDVAFPPEAT